MGKIWDYISIKGKSVMQTKTLVMITSMTLSLFHLVLLVFFAIFGKKILIALNVFSVMVYAICSVCAKRGLNLYVIFNIMYVEIVIYSVLSTLLIGMDCGFMLYLIAIIPLGYYMAYIFRDLKNNINPMVYTITAVVTFWGTRIVLRFVDTVYTFDNAIIDRTVYMFNYTSIVVAILFLCSTILSRVRNLEEKQRKQNEILDELSKRDPLTGLVNRRCIQERYERAERSVEKYAVILGDIDDFKLVNDTYGHDVGDEVLKMVADAFQSTIRTDDVVCRWGGEEILVFLPGAAKEQAVAVAERILLKIRDIKVATKDESSFGVTMTMGVSVSDEAECFAEIAKRADEKLYKGKRAGKNRIVND